MRKMKDKCNNETMFTIGSAQRKCWKKNPKCDTETKELVEETKKEREQSTNLQDW